MHRATVSLTLAQVFHGLFYAPIYIARGLGFFSEEGIDLTVHYATPPGKIINMLLDRQADIILTGAARLFSENNSAWRRELACIGQATAQSFFFLVSRAEERPFALRDLVGKKLILFPGTPTPWLCLQYLLKSAGIDPMTIQTMRCATVDEAVGEFLAGSGNYIELPEPYADAVADQYERPQIVPVAKLLGPVPFTVFLATIGMITQCPDRFQRFITSIARAQTWLREHSADEAAARLGPFFSEIDLDLIFRSIARYQLQDQWGSSPIISLKEFGLLETVLTGHSVTSEEHLAEIIDLRFTT